jgi:hypothetical protein
MRPYKDEIATNICLGYVYELTKIIDKLPVPVEGGIDLRQEVNLETGTIDYTLLGTLGNMINNPKVKIGITPDLLRGLRRGGNAYERHIKNIPTKEEILPLVKEKYVVMRLIGIGNDNKGEHDGCREIHTIDKLKNML